MDETRNFTTSFYTINKDYSGGYYIDHLCFTVFDGIPNEDTKDYGKILMETATRLMSENPPCCNDIYEVKEHVFQVNKMACRELSSQFGGKAVFIDDEEYDEFTEGPIQNIPLLYQQLPLNIRGAERPDFCSALIQVHYGEKYPTLNQKTQIYHEIQECFEEAILREERQQSDTSPQTFFRETYIKAVVLAARYAERKFNCTATPLIPQFDGCIAGAE